MWRTPYDSSQEDYLDQQALKADANGLIVDRERQMRLAAQALFRAEPGSPEQRDAWENLNRIQDFGCRPD